ncbi:MAG: hypothetical protein H0W37_05375, partial [Pseudonocardiales bacterium]|nr:hypothetical protein [Pseudonocardiales bacterium]
MAQAPKARLDAGATVEVRDGEMFVSGQVLPQLDLMSLANARIDYDSFKLSQADFSADTPVIHDNVEVDTTPGDEFGPDVDENGVPAQGIRAPLIEVLRKEFGARRVNRMMYDITQPMQRIRETLRANGYQRIIDDNEGWALGISTDVKYRGVSTTIPFKFMAVNPFGYTWPDDPSSKEFAIQALSLFGTMVHEFAHMRERNHDEDGFIPEQAKLVAIMGAEDGRSISNSLRYALAKHVDILKRGEDLLSGNSGGNPKSRGRRLSDATPDSIPSRVPAEPDRAGAGAQAPGGISARAAGERGLTPTGFDPGTQSAIQASPPRGANQGVDDNGNEQGQQDGSTEARRGAGEGPGPQAGFRSNGPGRARRRGQEPDPGRPGGRAAPGAAAGPAERAGAGGQLPLDGRDEGTDGQGRSAEDATGGPDDLSGETGEAGFQAGVPGQVRFAAERDAAPGSTWSADPSETFTVFGRDTGISKDAITRKLQNRHVDMLRAQQGMRRAGRSISEQADVIQREQAFHGRVSDQFRVFHQTELANLLQGLKQTGVSQDELGTFLNMRGAEAYNDHINRINPDPEMWDQGSGTHTDVANAYLGNLSPAQRFKYDRLAAIVDRMTKGTREYLVAAGLETRETIEAWEAAFPNYTPRHRDEVVGSIGDGTGGGFVAHRPFSKAAMGSDKAVIDVVANVVTQRENAIVKAEKTRVARSAWELAVDNPNADFWKAIDPSMDPAERRAALLSMGMDESLIDLIGNKPFVKRKDKRTGMVVRVPNPLLANNPMVFPVRINGQDKILLFNERSERAQGVAAALRNLDPDKLGELLTLSGKFSRFFAAINTQWNVIFGVVNLVRDTGSAMANLSTTPIRGMQGAVLKNLPAALLGVYNATRDRRAGKIPTGAWAARYEEFQRLGGKTGFRDMYENSASRTADLDKELRAVKGEGLWNRLGGRALFAWIGDYNDAMENSVRLSAWHAAVSSGRMTPEAAAIMAKNLTVNFNKKGQWATQAGALYAFFNASAQGTARLYETVTGPKGKAIIGGGLAMGALQAMMLAAAGFKEGEPPEFIKQRNLVIPNAASDKGYFLIPLPLGLHVIPNITRMAFEYANSGFKDAPKRVTEFLGMVADAFNPIGNAGLSMQTVAPTVI